MSFEEIQSKWVKTRKDHQCIWCDEKIESGTKARYRVYTFDGDFNADYMHEECYEAMSRTDADLDEGFFPGEFLRGKTPEEMEWDSMVEDAVSEDLERFPMMEKLDTLERSMVHEFLKSEVGLFCIGGVLLTLIAFIAFVICIL